MEYDIKFDMFGNRYYYKKGTEISHRENGPAVEHLDGTNEWWINGFRHREDGPAVECADGTKLWYINGYSHRSDGPAMISKYAKSWWKNGGRHREDGPAIEWSNGDKEWFINGEQLPYEKEVILNQWWDNKNGI
jgi:hypothetical protein